MLDSVFAISRGINEIGIVPTLVIICFIMNQVRTELKTLSKRYNDIDKRITDIEHNYISLSECKEKEDRSRTYLDGKLDSLHDKLDQLKDKIYTHFHNMGVN